MTYRTNIIADSTGSRVLLSATVRIEQGAAAGEHLTGMRLDPGDQPLHSEMTGDLGEACDRLERIASVLRQQGEAP